MIPENFQKYKSQVKHSFSTTCFLYTDAGIFCQKSLFRSVFRHMVLQASPKAKRNMLALLAAGIAAGFLNGLLGAGGGIILIYALSAMNRDTTPEGVRDNFAATVACVIPMTALSALLYTANGTVQAGTFSSLLIPAAAGGAAGAFLLDKINTKLLKKIFAALVVFAGIRMLTR